MNARFGRAIFAALVAVLLGALAIVAVTFEQRHSLGQPAILSEHLSSLADLGGALLWPLLMLASVSFCVVMWVGRDPEQPIRMIRRELEALTASNLDLRVTPVDSSEELRRFSTTLNQTLDKLESAVLANERLVADAAHELRTPLTAVRAALEVQHSKKPGDFLEDAIAEVDRAGKLIDDLLLLARSPSTGSRLELVDLDDVVMKEVARFKREHPNVEVVQDIHPVQQRLAKQDVASLIRNLLENAAKYGGGKVKMTLEVNENHSILHVDDNGPGIEDDQRDVVLGRFARLDHARDRATGGSGLGLAIVNETALAHGGEVSIDDGELGGCRFSVTLPLADPAARAVSNSSVGAPEPASSGRWGLKLLSAACVLAGLVGTGYVIQSGISASSDDGEAGLINRSNWTVTASSFGNEEVASFAVDGDPESRWTSGVTQGADDMWFEVDLGGEAVVGRIELRLASFNPDDYPRGYLVEVMDATGEWVEVASNDAVFDTFPVTVIEFEPVTATVVRINQTGSSTTQWWSIAELNLFDSST